MSAGGTDQGGTATTAFADAANDPRVPRRPPLREHPRTPLTPRFVAVAAGGAYLLLVVLALLVGATGGDGSGLEYLTAMLLASPWWAVLPSVAGLVAGGLLNAALVAWAAYAIAKSRRRRPGRTPR
jgi:hypothetical protein